jgi:ATP adenylyltransferase
MKKLWAPWRLSYILGIKDKNRSKKPSDCVFCKVQRGNSRSGNLILRKSKHVFVIMNKYPYANGHLMVIPNRHISDLTELTSIEHVEVTQLLRLSLKILKKHLKAQGFNIGMNLGEAAGAGIKDHLHYHIVPRWKGDHNFMPVISDFRVMPEYLKDTYLKLKKHF